MRVVVTGSEGQLGSALKLTCPADIEPVWLGHKDLDITDEAAVARHPAFEGADAIINTANVATFFISHSCLKSEVNIAHWLYKNKYNEKCDQKTLRILTALRLLNAKNKVNTWVGSA